MLPMSVGSQAAPFAMDGIHGAQAQAARLGHGHLRMKDAGEVVRTAAALAGRLLDRGMGYGLTVLNACRRGLRDRVSAHRKPCRR